ncbi:MAG TPA: hypothetical protein VFA90_09895 [Terriglobales bacterium]|nr:hypothetical protein [Terriglobales bacterium]
MRKPAIYLVTALFLLAFTQQLVGQETIFNVPSGDVLDKSKVYGEFDFAYRWDNSSGSYVPRVVVGVGHRIEIGVNLNGIASPGPSETTLSPTIKWKAYDGTANGWALVVGDDVFIPMQNRSYTSGNYLYGELTKTLKASTRFTFGAYDFTPNAVSSRNEAGGQFGVEQPIGKRVTLAADWYTGKQALGYLTPGLVIKLSLRATLYTAYEIGNSGASSGNRLLLCEFGWNFN